MKIFLAAPFTDRLDPNTGEFDPDYKSWMETIMNFIESKGHSLLSAHLREDWGKSLDSPSVALPVDLEWLDQSDLIIAHIGSPPSPGVQLEIGYCIAKKKPMILLSKRGLTKPYLMDGLGAVAKVFLIEFDEQPELLTQLDSLLHERFLQSSP